jgi:hypothetical protein
MKISVGGFVKKTVCVLGLSMILLAAGAFAEEEKAPPLDIELDFRFLRAGLTRKAVVEMLGTPGGQTESQTFALKFHKLMWTGPDGRRFVAAFINNRLWRWKTCSVSVADC